MNSTAQLARDPQAHLPTGPTHVASRSTQTRASNAARAALVVANVTPTGYRVGVFMADHARYATETDIRRNVVPGELFCYWPQAKIAAEMGCSERQVRRGVRSMREAGTLEVRRRVRPCEASYVWVQPVRSDVRFDGACVLSDVRSGVLSGVRSHTEPRKEPQNNHVGSSRARVVCEVCKHEWPDGYGTKCHECGHNPSTRKPNADTPAQEPASCTCGDAYHNSYQRRCVDCEGTPSFAQVDALREKHGCRGVDDRVGEDGGGDNPSVPETETRKPPETRGQRPDNSVLPEHEITQDGGEGEDEPPPKADHDALLRFWEEQRTLYGRKRTPLQHRSDRRRLARTVRKELANLEIGGDA